MKILRWIRLALKWYMNCWIQFFLSAADTSCSRLGPEEILRREDGLVWDPELRKFRKAKYESTVEKV